MRRARDPRRHDLGELPAPTARTTSRSRQELREKLHRARHERPQRALDRLAEQDKLHRPSAPRPAARPGTPFLELMSLAANRHYDGEAPQALLVTGVGVVSGREVMVIANDSSLKGGAWYPITTRKIVRALQVALENRLPVVHMLDSRRREPAPAGRDLRLGGPHLPAAVPAQRGRHPAARAWCSATAPRARAYTPTLCDQTIMVRERGRDVPRRPAAREGGDRRGGDRRGARRRRHAHVGVRHGGLRRRHRGRGAARSRATSSASGRGARRPTAIAATPSRRSTIPTSSTGSSPTTSRSSSRCAR